MNKYFLSLAVLLISSALFVVNAQEKPKKAWELGLGVSAFQMTRFTMLDAVKQSDGSYFIKTDKRDVLFGGNLYVAHELCRSWYLDFQGTIGYTNDPVYGGHQSRWLGMAGLGLQWRWGQLFDSRYIDPYLRVGGNYMYKGFDTYYAETSAIDGQDISWTMSNDYNKSGADARHLFPIAAGAGVNMWLNDHFGIGLQGDYLVMPHKDVANVWQGTVRLMYRIGGSSKKAAPQYVERVVEKPVDRIVERIVEKVVRDTVSVENEIFRLFDNVYFDFDKSAITAESQPVLDDVATIMKSDTSRHFLIMGFTDARGSEAYNVGLSERRAKAVVDALIDRGVPANMLKWYGVGKRAAYAKPADTDRVRRGDRKITIEIITNMDYWECLPAR